MFNDKILQTYIRESGGTPDNKKYLLKDKGKGKGNVIYEWDYSFEKPSTKKIKEIYDKIKAQNKAVEYKAMRRAEFEQKESDGVLPKDIQEHFDAIYETLEKLELSGIELSPKMSSIIRVRRTIKVKFPKE